MTRWWRSRTPRERLAMTILGLLLPPLLGIPMLTMPLQERLATARRVHTALQQQSSEVLRRCQRIAELQTTRRNMMTRSSEQILGCAEALLDQLPPTTQRPTLHRTQIAVGSHRQPAASWRYRQAQPHQLHQWLTLLAASPLRVAAWESALTDNDTTISGAITLWIPENHQDR